MGYTPHTEKDVSAMLKAIGVNTTADLFWDVPDKYRFPTLNLPKGMTQMEVAWELEELSNDNFPAGKTAMFLGAGAYNHYSPPVVNHMILRGEFLTAYTPYQPEISQGTLQTMYEYQSMICALTAMEVANASHYDGATSLAEAAILALNAARDGRKKIVISPGVHPEYRAVVRTYTQGMGVTIVGDDAETVDPDSLISQIDSETAMVVMQYPDFFGQIGDVGAVIAAAHDLGALVCVVTLPVTLGMLKPPGQYGADIVVGEGQGLGIPLSFGGPYLGFFATREKFVRKMAGRLVGETEDTHGQPGYVLTLATREQHIRRDKATSNICTNQGLMALAATVYMSAMGKHGLRQVAELCYHKAHYAADQIEKINGYSVDRGQPFFMEFVIQCPRPVAQINQYLLDVHSIVGGYNLENVFPGRKNQMLLAVTEMCSRDEIDALVEALGEAE